MESTQPSLVMLHVIKIYRTLHHLKVILSEFHAIICALYRPTTWYSFKFQRCPTFTRTQRLAPMQLVTGYLETIWCPWYKRVGTSEAISRMNDVNLVAQCNADERFFTNFFLLTTNTCFTHVTHSVTSVKGPRHWRNMDPTFRDHPRFQCRTGTLHSLCICSGNVKRSN